MFTRVLVPLDTSTVAEQALPTAAAIAKAATAELRLVLVHETDPFNGFSDAPWGELGTAMERAYLDRKACELQSRFGIHVATEHPNGRAAEMIIAVATARGSDLIVMTTHGRTGLKREWLGSVADSIVRALDVPVLMLRPVHGQVPASTDLRAFQHIVIPLDGSPRAESIIDAALSLGGPRATYYLMRIVTPLPVILNAAEPYAVVPIVIDSDATGIAMASADRYLQGIADRVRATGMTSVAQVVAASSSTARTLLDLAQERHVDLIAIATHGRGASRLVLGSVADALLRGGATALLMRRGQHS